MKRVPHSPPIIDEIGWIPEMDEEVDTSLPALWSQYPEAGDGCDGPPVFDVGVIYFHVPLNENWGNKSVIWETSFREIIEDFTSGMVAFDSHRIQDQGGMKLAGMLSAHLRQLADEIDAITGPHRPECDEPPEA